MPMRRNLLLALLLLSVAAWLVLVWVDRAQRPEPNYSLIEEGLYMGGEVDEPPPGTRAVLNLCEWEDPYRAETHLSEFIPDRGPAPSLAWLRRMVDFVDSKRREGQTVYVHCSQGKSRSGLVVVAYEMRKNKWPRDQALAFVRSRRPQTRPNRTFLKLLDEWERALKAQ